MPDTSPTPVDLDAIEARSKRREDPSLSRDEWEMAEGESADDVPALIAEIRRSRASIGPDSERKPGPDDIVVSREALTTVLDLIHERVLQEPLPASLATRTVRFWRDELADLAVAAAALSQPHPAQEQQT